MMDIPESPSLTVKLDLLEIEMSLKHKVFVLWAQFCTQILQKLFFTRSKTLKK